MKSVGHALLRFVLQLLSGTSKNQRIVLFGVRRSGNHALTNWLTNAVEKEQSDLTPLGERPPLSHAFCSPSGNVIHLNELNELDFRSTFKLFLLARKKTRKCKVLLLSFEDVRPSEYPNFRRLSGKEVHIKRSALEVISSRYHNLHRKANNGIGWSRQSCDAYFLDTLREFQRPSGSAKTLTWEYNRWLNSPKYRKSFLQKLDLSFDLIPHHSGVGGGSSFHGTSGRIESKLDTRLQKVEPQTHWVSFLTGLLKNHPDLFSDKERQTGQAFIEGASKG
jgi:hypothetical protein